MWQQELGKSTAAGTDCTLAMGITYLLV